MALWPVCRLSPGSSLPPCPDAFAREQESGGGEEAKGLHEGLAARKQRPALWSGMIHLYDLAVRDFRVLLLWVAKTFPVLTSSWSLPPSRPLQSRC